jgi:chloramphenicol-sensitive protein RarD
MPPSSVGAPPGAASPATRSGILFALGAYGIWGFLPAYFLLLAPAGPIEIVACRIVFSLVFCALLITVNRAWPALLAILRSGRMVLGLGLAALLIIVNWQVYVFAVLNEQVNEAALGYFINPIVTVLLGVLILRERLRVAQWAAVAVSAVAVVVLAIDYGAFPWVSLTLAGSFGLYGLVKKKLGARVDAVSGLMIETAWLLPVAVAQFAFVAATSGIVIGTAGTLNAVLLALSGVATSVPLILFAAASRRLRLVHVGLIQYLTPVIQFLLGTFVLHEAMPPARWAGFALVWVALLVLSIDMVVNAKAARRALPLPG